MNGQRYLHIYNLNRLLNFVTWSLVSDEKHELLSKHHFCVLIFFGKWNGSVLRRPCKSPNQVKPKLMCITLYTSYIFILQEYWYVCVCVCFCIASLYRERFNLQYLQRFKVISLTWSPGKIAHITGATLAGNGLTTI